MKWFQSRFFQWVIPGLFVANILGAGSSWAGNVEVLDEKTLEGLLPASFLDHQGFAIPRDFALAAPGSGPLRVAPMYPLFKKQFLSRKFVGVVVPAKFLGTEKACRSGRGGFTIGGELPEEAQAAANQISQIRLENGLRLVPYYFRCQVYGIRSDLQVRQQNSTTIGLSLEFGGPETVTLGDDFTLGMSLTIGGPVTRIGEASGVNLGESFQQLLDGVDLALHGDDAEALIARTVQFTPMIRQALAANHLAATASGTAAAESLLEAVYFKNLELAPASAPGLARRVPRERLSPELSESLAILPQKLEREVKWRQTLKGESESTVVVNEPRANRLIQTVCDRLAQVYEVPRELWPRCRIAATWVPNAYAYPGGDIFITAGLLGILSDLDSVALVLSHEIGHVVGRHTTGRLPLTNAVNYTANGLALAGTAALLPWALGGGMGSLGEVSWLSWFPQSMAASTGGSFAMEKAMKLLMLGPVAALMAHSRADEWQADRFGHETALAAGAEQASLHAGWGQFSKFLQTYFEMEPSLVDRMLADHPDSEERQDEITRRAPGLLEALREFQAANPLPESLRAEYRTIHEVLQPRVHAYGAAIRAKARKGQSLELDYARASLLAPAGRCIHFALGAAKAVEPLFRAVQ